MIGLSLPVFSFQEGTIKSTVYINPLKISVSAPKSAKLGTIILVEAQIFNLGTGRIKDASATIYLPFGLKLVSKKETQKMGVLPPGSSKRVFWKVEAESLGNYIILVKAEGIDQRTDQLVSAEGTAVVEVNQESIWWKFFRFWNWF